jgi:DNA polymerase-4
MRAPRKSLSKEVTFDKDVSDTAILHDTLLRLAEDVGRGLRQEGNAGHTATLKIRLANFETHTRQRHLEEATDSDRIIFREAWNLFQSSGFAGRTIRLIGIGMSGLTDMRGQGALFEGGKDSSNKESKLFEAIDRIRKRHGSGSIGLGGLRKPGKTDE